MGIKTGEITVYPISVFLRAPNKDFWLGNLERILESYPFLEHYHRPAFYILLFIKQAEGTASLDGRTIRLDQHKVICIKPNSVFSLDINRIASGHIICFTERFFSLRYNHNVLYQFAFLHSGVDPFKRVTAELSERWSHLLHLLEGEYHAHRKGTESVLRSYLNILLHEFDRLFLHQQQAIVHTLKREKIILLEQYIQKYYQSKKRTSDYAVMLCVTPNYLNKICKEETGNTAGDIIRQHITIEAQRLLYHTSQSVNEVSYSLGFDSASYFITFFKKQTGMTPEQFRKSQDNSI